MIPNQILLDNLYRSSTITPKTLETLPPQFVHLFNVITNIKFGEVIVKVQDALPIYATAIKEGHKL